MVHVSKIIFPVGVPVHRQNLKMAKRQRRGEDLTSTVKRVK